VFRAAAYSLGCHNGTMINCMLYRTFQSLTVNVNVTLRSTPSVRSSVDEVAELCSLSHIVCLQEHSLFPHELSLLSNISADFLAIGS